MRRQFIKGALAVGLSVVQPGFAAHAASQALPAGGVGV